MLHGADPVATRFYSIQNRFASCIPRSIDEIERAWKVDIDRLGDAIGKKDWVAFDTVKRELTREQFSVFCMRLNVDLKTLPPERVLTAARYNDGDTILSLVGDMDSGTRVNFLCLGDMFGITPLHCTATADLSVEHSYGTCSIKAASAIKTLVYFKDDRRGWLKLLSARLPLPNTPVHLAARLPNAELLNLFSEGLTSEEWQTVLAVRNRSNNTAVHTHFVWGCRRSEQQQKECIAALRGPLTDIEWVDFLIRHDVLPTLKYFPTGQTHLQYIVDGITDPGFANLLVSKYESAIAVCPYKLLPQ